MSNKNWRHSFHVSCSPCMYERTSATTRVDASCLHLLFLFLILCLFQSAGVDEGGASTVSFCVLLKNFTKPASDDSFFTKVIQEIEERDKYRHRWSLIGPIIEWHTMCYCCNLKRGIYWEINYVVPLVILCVCVLSFSAESKRLLTPKLTVFHWN